MAPLPACFMITRVTSESAPVSVLATLLMKRKSDALWSSPGTSASKRLRIPPQSHFYMAGSWLRGISQG